MIRYEDAKLAFAQAIYDLLTTSDAQEWFSVEAIAAKSSLNVKSAFVSRVLSLSNEEDDIFHPLNNDGDSYWTLGKEGFDLIENTPAILEERLKGAAPASDRVVQFNHNAPDAQAISSQLDEVIESVRGTNDPDVEEQERVRVFNALRIAKQVWESGHFRLIQLKVGVILAVEDAVRLLSKTAKHVTAALLVDAIKAFVKNRFNTDLDAI